MVQLNIKTTASELDEGMIESDLRPYLGMSQIGHSCERYLWFAFRWCFTDSYSRRVGRLFNRGHREEEVIIKDLERIGIECYGDQTECNMLGKHVSGHCDGMCTGVLEAPKTEHLLEFKTMNVNAYKDILKKGVQLSKPQYYAQLQLYMKGLKLKRALFICVNKNDDAYYIERVHYNAKAAKALVEKAQRVLMAEVPIDPPFAPTWYECKWCSAKDQCRQGKELHFTCRSCYYVSLGPEATWLCNYNSDPETINIARQRVGCTERKAIKI